MDKLQESVKIVDPIRVYRKLKCTTTRKNYFKTIFKGIRMCINTAGKKVFYAYVFVYFKKLRS